MPAEKLAGSLAMIQPLWHHLIPGQTHASGELYQTSLMSALLDGIYEGSMTYGELRKHGDFGLGTFNELDGEMVGFDGTFYQLRSDGSASLVAPDQKTPFAAVTFFRPHKELRIKEGLTKPQLLALLEEATDQNLFAAIKITGQFQEVRTRTVERQSRPFPRLTEAAAHEATHIFSEVQGTLSGFRTPAYAQGLGVAGFHMHFIQQDKSSGGHALAYTVRDVVVQIAILDSFHIVLPTTDEFLKATLAGDQIGGDIESSEG